MIGYLEWEVLQKTENSVLLFTKSWVGYEVWVASPTALRAFVWETLAVYVYHHRTENSEQLYAFWEYSEKKIFTELLKIPGVGGKVALQILGLWEASLIHALAHQDVGVIESVKGIGKKMAQKIFLEMKDKEFIHASSFASSESWKQEDTKNIPQGDIYESIKITLQNMGFPPKEIDRVMRDIPSDYTDIDTILPYVIQRLS